jgi:His-Xaa-Ser system protein HxsD
MAEDVTMQGNLEIHQKEGSVLVSVNPKIYPLDVVLSAGYLFTDKNYILIDGDPNEEIIVEIRPKDKKENLTKIGGDFNNELVNYANYAVQTIKNEKLRDAILKRVLLTNTVASANTSAERIGPNETVCADYLEKEAKPWKIEDPLGIAKPWEEQYGKNKDKPSKK